jgi:tetratricopeptide (TPR) repeat protein
LEHFPNELKAALMEKAEGVPLFVEEVTKTLLDLGVLVGLGAVHAFAHRPEPALRQFDAALALARDTGDLAYQAFCHGQRLFVHAAGRGSLVETAEDLEQALCLLSEMAQPKRRAETLLWPAVVLQWRGEFARAVGYLREVAELAEREHVGFVFGQAVWMLGPVTPQSRWQRPAPGHESLD